MPCGPDPAMTTTCEPACVICDINGFTGINNSNVVGQVPPGFCTTQAHHMQWIAFIAGSVDLTITVKPSNCQLNTGLEIGIYKSLDCSTFQLVSNCDTDVQPGETGVFTNTVPLVIGQYYYFVMDGSNDDICNYTINVTKGTTAVGQLPPPSPIVGPAFPCKGGTATYSIPELTGATLYVWSIDGITVDTTAKPEISIPWPTAGQHTVCVHAANVCDEGQPSCLDINVTPLPPTLIEKIICQGDTLFYENKALSKTGFYSFDLQSPDGCDSIVNIDLTVAQPAIETLSLTICTVDSFQVGNLFFKNEGIYNIPLSANNGCDSMVILNLNTEICPIHGQATGDILDCNNSTDGEISIKMDDGTGPYSIQWAELTGSLATGSSAIQTSAGSGKITGLASGIYNLTITDAAGKIGYLNAQITAPTAVVATDSTAVFGGFEISCPGFSDGKIEIAASGGFAPYSINWSTGATSFILENLAAGAYFFTITDVKGCTFSASQNLTEPPPIDFILKKTDPGCAPSNDGVIAAENITGGQPPYQFALNSGVFQQNPTFSALTPGHYFLKIQDAFGCLDSIAASLEPPPVIDIDLGDPITIELGDSVKLQPIASPAADFWDWAVNRPGLSCYDCPKPWAEPSSDQTYFLTVDAADACPNSDSVRVSVIKIRRVFIPNIFTPDDDGENDFLTVFAGKGTKNVRKFQIWSRWGELVFERENFAPNDLSLGWDGSFRGKKVMPGVFTVVAEVEFIDGFVEKRKGDVTVAR